MPTKLNIAKTGFLELRKGGNWNIQGIIVASEKEPVVSCRMVRWITSINLRIFVAVEVRVKRPPEPVESCRVSGLELHITKCFVLALAPASTSKVAEAASENAVLVASTFTRLDNIAMHKRALVQQVTAVSPVLVI
ncbi:putative aspartate--tRNA ligase [Seiridium cardinale]|uniref:Aspartate--tRNA ligase n=1 Tax=Seiridium cardinale TaxID=138064 RepID=A0ABR2XPL7_9PEZI